MRVTIIPEDCLIVIDGQSVIIDDMSMLDESIHAVQWYGTNGTIEHKDTTITNAVVLTTLEEITELSLFQELINTGVAKIEDSKINAENQLSSSETTTVRARAERDFKLIQSDWTQLSDVTLSPEQLTLWKEYRQQLRDITLQSNFPNNIIWPEKPE